MLMYNHGIESAIKRAQVISELKHSDKVGIGGSVGGVRSGCVCWSLCGFVWWGESAIKRAQIRVPQIYPK